MGYAISIMRLELLVARRNLWVLIAMALMGGFSLVLTFSGVSASGALDVSAQTVAMSSITTLSVYLVPLLALLLSFDAIAGEIERGTLLLIFTYPMSRGALLVGKCLAHLVVLGLAVVVGLGLSSALLFAAGVAGGFSMQPLILFLGSALALGCAFLGLGYLISSLVRNQGAAAGLAIAVWLLFVVMYDLGLLGALVAFPDSAFAKDWFEFALLFNPADAFRMLNMPATNVAALSAGLDATVGHIPAQAAAISLLLWPVAMLLIAWRALKRIEL